VKDYLKNSITATTVFLLIVGRIERKTAHHSKNKIVNLNEFLGLIEVLSMLSALFLCCGIRKGFA